MAGADTQPGTRLLRRLGAEFRRRGVWRAASLYVVGAWVAIQAAGELSQAFAWPRTVAVIVIVLAMAGFPVVVLAAWCYRLGDVEAEPSAAGFAFSRRQLRWSLAVALAAGLSLLTATGWFALRRHSNDPPIEPLPRFIVLPFTDISTGAGQAYLAPSLAAELTTYLNASGLDAGDDAVVRAYATDGLAGDSIARLLGADYIIHGDVLSGRDLARVTVRMTEAATGRVVDTVRVERGSSDPIALVDAVTADLGSRIQEKAGRALRLQRWRSGTTDARAYDLLLRAQRQFDVSRAKERQNDSAGSRMALDAADSLLVRALGIDDGYAAAWLQRADVARARALQQLALGRPAGLDTLLLQGDHYATRACDLEPVNARAFETRGVLRTLRAVRPTAERAVREQVTLQAFSDLGRALELDPRRIRAARELANLYADRGELQRALSTLEDAYRQDTYREAAAPLLASLFTLSFELARDADAEFYCGEIGRKGNPTVAAHCELHLAAWSTVRQDRSIEDAWRTAAAARSAGIENRAAAPQLEIQVAGVIARAGLADSARAVLARARAAGVTAAAQQLEAGVRVLLHDYDTASILLAQYARTARTGMLARSRRFAALPGNPLLPRATNR